MVWRNLGFAVFTVGAVLLLAEGVLALAGIHPLSRMEDPFVGFSRRLPLFVTDGGTMVTAPGKLGWFNRQSFRRDKPPGGYRIFCLGGSTTYGHPWDDAVSFCGWLRRFLEAADPSRPWEVVNAGGISYASYRVTALMEELAGYQPDLFVVYSGHNEFIEERSLRSIAHLPQAVIEANAVLSNSRLYSAVRAAIPKLRGTQPHILNAEVAERLAKSVGPVSYHRDEEGRAGIVAQYRFNLERMVALARGAGSDIVFVMPAANLKDMSPFKSQHRAGLPADAAQRFAVRLAEVEAAEPQRRLALLDEALAIDDRHAKAHYERGRALLALGRYGEARAAFLRALDEDIVPLRMLPQMAEDLRRVAAATGTPLIDFVAMLEDRVRRELGHDLLGAEWFVDHVHPSIEAYRLLGLELVERLRAKGVVRPGADWGPERIAAITERTLASLDAAAHGRALMNLGIVLGWAGRLEEAHRLLLQARDQLGEDMAVLLKLGHSAERLGHKEEAGAFYERAAAAHPNSAEPHRWLADLGGEAALRHRAEAVRLAPDSADDVAALAEALAERGDWAGAARFFSELARLRPDIAVPRLNLAVALVNAGRTGEAAEQFAAAARLDPTAPAPHVGLADLHARLGDLDAARRELTEAVRLAPDDMLARLNLGALLANGGRVQEALPHFQEAVRLAPDHLEARINLAQALRQLGRNAEAAEHFQAARRLETGRR